MATGRKNVLAPELYVSASTVDDQVLMEQMRQQDQHPLPIDYRKPKFALVVGPSPFTMPRGWEFFLTSPYEGATYISTVLHNAGYPVKIIDVRYEKDPLTECLRQLEQHCDVLGICTYEDNFPFVCDLINRVKERTPHVPIICGGSLVTSVPHIFMHHTKTDIAVISEGELTILELMDSYCKGNWERDLKAIRGIWYRENGAVKRTLPRGQMKTLDYLPRMRLDLWPQYHSPKGLQKQIIASYSRGCKMDCDFCYRTTPQVVAKSPQKFREDLKWLKEQYDVEFIMFVDLTFSSLKQQTVDMCDVIGDYGIRWSCLTRCSDVDPLRLSSMKKSGCDIILYGIESLDQAALKRTHKGNSKDMTIRAMNLTYEADIRFGSLLIVGLPSESQEVLEFTANWAEEHNHVTRVKYLSLMPGTPYYREFIEKGVVKSEMDHLNWLSIEQALHHDEFVNVCGLPEDVLRQAYKKIYDAYQPGPVMDFKHFPEYFEYTYPNSDNGNKASIEYARKYSQVDWRKDFSSGGAFLLPGSEQFTFSSLNLDELHATGAAHMVCGAKLLAPA